MGSPAFLTPRVLGLVMAAAFCLPQLPAQAPAAQAPAGSQKGPQTPEPGAPNGPQLAAAVDPNTYKIGPEDVIEIIVWREPELSGQVRVRPDGKVTLRLVGEIVAVPLTPAELQQKATEAFSTVLNSPKVMVSIIAVQSKKYYVSGSVGRSGPFPLVTPTTVLQAISLCGLGEWAKRGNIVIMRGDKRIKFNYNEVIKGKNPDQNILLEDGDHIFVP